MSKAVKQRKLNKRLNREWEETREVRRVERIEREKKQSGTVQYEARQAIIQRMKTVSFGGLYDL